MLLLHLLTKWSEAWRSAKAESQKPPGFIDYLTTIKPQVAVGIVGSVGAFLIADALGWMNAGMAGACGYMGSSLCKKFVDQAQSTLKRG